MLDVDSSVQLGEPFNELKLQFAAAKALVRIIGGNDEVLRKYHPALVAPFCLSAVKSFFDRY